MSDSKGISLRKTKRSKKPAISAPQQISGPINSSSGGAPRSNGGKPPFDAPPPQRPQNVGGKVGILALCSSMRTVLILLRRPLILSSVDILPDSTIYRPITIPAYLLYLFLHYQTSLLHLVIVEGGHHLREARAVQLLLLIPKP